MRTESRHLAIQALLCGMLWLTQQTTGSPDLIPENLDKSVQNVNSYLRTINDVSKYSGGPVFLSMLKDYEVKFEVRLHQNSLRILMGEMLNVYLQILSNMLNKTQEQRVKEDLLYLKSKLEELKREFFKTNTAKLKQSLEELEAIKTSNELVQRKAIFELKKVFREAASIGGPDSKSHQASLPVNKRRVRQTLRSKMHKQ
uniref:Interferon gamma n=1 Tax=Denticeps clupeoides TaxID=299321 RepID=A0AAY4EKS5_9TELE